MKLSKNSGLSLVEIMIVTAVLGGLAIVGMQMTKTQTKAVAKASFDSESNLITNEIVSILSDPNKCFATLGGMDASSTSTGINSINGNKYYSQVSSSAPVNGYGNANINISTYALSATAADIASNNSSLLINYQNKNILKGTSAVETITKKVKLYVEVDGSNKIIRCRSLSSSSADIWTRGAGSVVHYNGGKVGVGTSTPQASLDIAWEVKIANSGAACTGATEGTLRYNSSSKLMEFCNGTSWGGIGGGVGILVDMYQCPGPVSLGGGAWGYYGCRNQITNTPTCRVIEYPSSATFSCTYVGKMSLTP